MKNLVFSAGQYRLDTAGATIVVTQNLFYESPSYISGAIIGPGKFLNSGEVRNDFYQIDTSSEYIQKTAYLRQLLRIRRFNKYYFPLNKLINEIENEISSIADKIATQKLEILLKNNTDIEVVVGLAGLSLNIGKLAKKHGFRYGIHSQFCHPYFQNEQLEYAYHSLNFKPPLVSKRKLERQLETIDLADFIWCPSEFVQKTLVGNGVPNEKAFVNYLGVDVNRFKFTKSDRFHEDVFTILFVGNVGIQKGIHVLLEAVELTGIDQMEIIFNGGSDSLADVIIEDFRKRVRSRKIKIVVDVGDPRRHFKKSSVFILPSVHDAFGISVLEAMSAQLPVIVSDHVGAKEIIINGINGFIFTSGNADELAKNILFFYKNSEKREEFGKKSAEISSNYDLHKKGKELEMKIVSRL